MLCNIENEQLGAKHSKRDMWNEQTSHRSLQTVRFHLHDVQKKTKPQQSVSLCKHRWLNYKEKQGNDY